MKNPKVHVAKEYEGRWMVWTETNGLVKCANIVAFDDHFMGRVKKHYRVDVAGKTINSLIETFQSAKAIAKKAVLSN